MRRAGGRDALSPGRQELVQGLGEASSTEFRLEGQFEEGGSKRALRRDGDDADEGGFLSPAPDEAEAAAATTMVKLRVRLPPFAFCTIAERPARAGIRAIVRGGAREASTPDVEQAPPPTVVDGCTTMLSGDACSRCWVQGTTLIP
ncbi:unnamed protein product, partial [Symbiodinium sp. KB8]